MTAKEHMGNFSSIPLEERPDLLVCVLVEPFRI